MGALRVLGFDLPLLLRLHLLRGDERLAGLRLVVVAGRRLRNMRGLSVDRGLLGVRLLVVVFLRHLSWHGVCSKVAGVALDRRNTWLPHAQLVLGLVKHIARGLGVGERLVRVAWYDWGVVEHLDQLARVLGKHDLLLGALDDGSGVDIVGLLELLARDVGQLRFGDEGLGFGAHELLLELGDFGG